ncbi:MAG: ParB/RepB/Spo0J family partition protein [Sphingomonadales bacterium]|mgnify:CR=1 FL=1
MSGRQKKYLDDLLADENRAPVEPAEETGRAGRPMRAPMPPVRSLAADAQTSAATAPQSPSSRRRPEGTTLLGRQSALARVASGEVKQVTQLQLDPARVRVWPGNARRYEALSEESCADLISSIVAEGGQKVPAIVRRVEGDADHDYEVIAGTRRHWTVQWLRANNYPNMRFLAEVYDLDDESAFRLSDLENRARKDVTDMERARNYAAALRTHYKNHLTRMAERLNLSKGWLSKMVKVASLPQDVVSAFAAEADIKLKPSYPLAQALSDDGRRGLIINEARRLSKEQAVRRKNMTTPISAPEVIKRLLNAGIAQNREDQRYVVRTDDGRPAITVISSNRQGVTLRLHAGSGMDNGAIADGVKEALVHLSASGRGLMR